MISADGNRGGRAIGNATPPPSRYLIARSASSRIHVDRDRRSAVAAAVKTACSVSVTSTRIVLARSSSSGFRCMVGSSRGGVSDLAFVGFRFAMSSNIAMLHDSSTWP